MTETEALVTLAENSRQEPVFSAGHEPHAGQRETDQGTRAAALEPGARPPGANTHACGAWWTGSRTSHCAGANCHRTFSSITAFDRHQRNRPSGGVECVDPASVGLVAVRKPYGVLWSLPVNGAGNPHARLATDAVPAGNAP